MTTTPSLEEQAARQKQLLEGLTQNPAWDGPDSTAEDISRIETHGATVLLGRHHAIKMKKPVLFGHMDYSTPDLRHYFSGRELDYNRRTAPQLYLGLLKVTLNDNGDVELDGSGAALDWLVRMRRFPAGARLDEYAARQGIDDILTDKLTDAIVSLHRKAQKVSAPEDAPDFKDVITRNFVQLDDFCSHILDKGKAEQFRDTLYRRAEQHAEAFRQRVECGWVRFGHGDLHLQNICVLDDTPLPFDAIEYLDEFVISDILYDLSFLLMDLIDKCYPDAANRIFNRYLAKIGWLTKPDELAALKLLPFYLAMRAGIRTHVAAARAGQSEQPDDFQALRQQTRQLLEDASAYLSPPPPSLVAVGGLSGSGKSTLSRALAPRIGAAPGAVHIRSDVIRRLLIGWDDYTPMPQTAYTPEMSEQVYDTMKAIARQTLATGHSVIMDAVSDRPEDQKAFQQLAVDCGVPFTGLWLSVRPEVMAARIEGRRRDASDATVAILEQQLQKLSKKTVLWQQVDGNGTPEQTLQNALAAVGEGVRP
ncbi:bifunctional aminoglycoside phosphotransferase/ATP-binding protein [Sneathiella chinensis]|uniref:DNA-binding protein n=1 Tax=Sneathiella chinensis TaxID=349750 RepID=A0ABQ5U2Y2_9PROT|nr:bifunctional aminoglycoside phosphotransferase/ATP-binding protein [Sneathiella chinensis]GLQ06542.1 DNA-binding protein [Sneathiella chinensis]